VVLVIERLARDLFRGDQRERRDLPADLVEGPARLRLDVAARGLHELLALLLRGLLGVVLERVARAPGADHDVLRLLTRLAQPRSVLLEQLVGLLAGLGGRVDRVLDRAPPLVERLGDARERELPQDEEADPEREQRPDHQPHARGDEEVARARGDDGCRSVHGQPPRKKAIRPKMKA
jgi:hypothetical protein